MPRPARFIRAWRGNTTTTSRAPCTNTSRVSARTRSWFRWQKRSDAEIQALADYYGALPGKLDDLSRYQQGN